MILMRDSAPRSTVDLIRRRQYIEPGEEIYISNVIVSPLHAAMGTVLPLPRVF